MAKKISRAKRFESIKDSVSASRYALEDLRNELQNWLDNMPENLQESALADQLTESIDELDDAINSLEEVVDAEIIFPNAFNR